RLDVEIDDGLFEVARHLAAQDGRSVESLLVAYLLRDAQARGLIEPAPPPRWAWRDGKIARVAPEPPKEAPPSREETPPPTTIPL
ncbi:MAG: hypothetical protein CUN48_19615, partial [Candidatus Thermofonsia Clade 3 bacterium]